MKKIAILTPFLARGGLEKIAITQAEELNKIYDVTLIILDNHIEDYKYNGEKIYLNLELQTRNIFKRIFNILKASFLLRKLCRKYKFDLVISHGELSNFPNVLSNSKCLLTIHENRFSAYKDLQGRLANKILENLYTKENVKKIVTVSEDIRKTIIENTTINKDLIISIHNPHDIDSIIELSQENNEDYKAIFKYPTLITVGRLIYQKGQWYLLRIFSKVKINHPDSKLIILGDADLKSDLIKLANNLNLRVFSIWDNKQITDEYDVYFLGFQSNPFKFIRNSDYFVMTSLREGLPNTIIESLACGNKIISTDCKSGPREILFPELSLDENINKYIENEIGTLMPNFKSDKFIDENVDISDEEEIWIEYLSSKLNKTNKNINYKSIDRARNFDKKRIINLWKIEIDKII